MLLSTFLLACVLLRRLINHLTHRPFHQLSARCLVSPGILTFSYPSERHTAT